MEATSTLSATADARKPDDAPKSWRAHYKVHPAADRFPMMSEAKLRELSEDIKAHGLKNRIIFWAPAPGEGKMLLDGRNRLDALELAGLPTNNVQCTTLYGNHGVDPYAYALSANYHRRDLTDEQRREVIAGVLKAKPELSDREIGRQLKADHKTIAKVRAEKEATGEVSPVGKRVGADGKARKPAAKKWRRTPEDFQRDIAAKRAAESGMPEVLATPEKSASEDAENIETESPEQIVKNFLDTVSRHSAVLRAYQKIFKVAALDEEQKAVVRTAIGRLITKWKSLERAV